MTQPVNTGPNANEVVANRINQYHTATHSMTLASFASVPWFWLAAAFRALERSPTLYPAAVVIGHLTTFLASNSLPGGGMDMNTPFRITTEQLELLGMSSENIADALTILAEADLVGVERRNNRPWRITVRCGDEDLERLKELYVERRHDGPASSRRHAKSGKQKSQAVEAPKANTIVTAEVARSLGASGWKEKTGKGAAGHARWVHSARGHTLRFAAKGEDRVEVLVAGLGRRDAERLTNDDDAVTMALTTTADGDADPSWTLTYNRAGFAATFIGGLRKILVKAPRTKA